MYTQHLPITTAVSPVLGYLRSTAKERGPNGERLTPALPFITISRQAGIDGAALAHRLAQHLNTPTPERPWTVFDHELVNKVDADHNISVQLVEMLERANRTWVEDLFSGMSLADRHEPSELKIFRSLVSTVRALAQAGLTILVGRGGFMITHDMPAGIHLRLVAPLEHRIRTIMRIHNETHTQAAQRLQRLDEERAAFLHQHWPDRQPAPELFTLTLNAGMLSEEQMAACVLTLLKR